MNMVNNDIIPLPVEQDKVVSLIDHSTHRGYKAKHWALTAASVLGVKDWAERFKRVRVHYHLACLGHLWANMVSFQCGLLKQV